MSIFFKSSVMTTKITGNEGIIYFLYRLAFRRYCNLTCKNRPVFNISCSQKTGLSLNPYCSETIHPSAIEFLIGKEESSYYPTVIST